jgi:sirohydrochlorin cobaltochelatase
MSTIEALPENTGILICGHGSRAKLAAAEFSLLAKGLRDRYPGGKIEYGFLEYSAPNIHMALDSLLEQGVKKIYAVPGMLFLATHARNDIPSVLTTYQDAHPGLEIEYGNELGLHEEMIEAFQTRILEALGYDSSPAVGALYDTMLVVVGRGTSVAGANAEAAKLTRIVCENLGFGWSETVYSGVTFPSVGRGLEMALMLGFRKIVVAPYFLFGGRLIDRIYGYVDKIAAENPQVEFHKADYLRDQSHVINTFIARIEETVSANPEQISLMQDFQARLARGEVDVHHHHAEFQPAGEALTHPHNHDHDHAHSHDHQHDHAHEHVHHHAPYRHIGHPHGPRTMINENVCCCFMSQFPQDIIDEETARKPMLEGTPSCKRSA